MLCLKMSGDLPPQSSVERVLPSPEVISHVHVGAGQTTCQVRSMRISCDAESTEDRRTTHTACCLLGLVRVVFTQTQSGAQLSVMACPAPFS